MSENTTADDGTVIEQIPSYPCECPNCGGGVAYATTESDEKVVLCTGDCGEWRFVDK